MTIRGLPLQPALMEHLDAEEMEKLEVVKIQRQERPETQVLCKNTGSEHSMQKNTFVEDRASQNTIFFLPFGVACKGAGLTKGTFTKPAGLLEMALKLRTWV